MDGIAKELTTTPSFLAERICDIAARVCLASVTIFGEDKQQTHRKYSSLRREPFSLKASKGFFGVQGAMGFVPCALWRRTRPESTRRRTLDRLRIVRLSPLEAGLGGQALPIMPLGLGHWITRNEYCEVVNLSFAVTLLCGCLIFHGVGCNLLMTDEQDGR